MKKIFISLVVIITYLFVSFHSVYMANAISDMNWSHMMSMQDENKSNCMWESWSCEHEYKCQIDANNKYQVIQNNRTTDKKQKIAKNFDLKGIELSLNDNQIRWPTLAYSIKHDSNYFSFLICKKTIVLRS